MTIYKLYAVFNVKHMWCILWVVHLAHLTAHLTHLTAHHRC
jgi:hypothetical protein